METITEKTTVKGKPAKVVKRKPSYTVTEKDCIKKGIISLSFSNTNIRYLCIYYLQFNVYITYFRSEHEHTFGQHDRSLDGVNFADRKFYVRRS